jgi:hypothetical protein
VHIHPTALRHWFTPAAIRHAIRHPLRVVEADEGVALLIGPDAVGNLLEVGVVDGLSEPVVSHAMPARPKFLR